MRVSGCLYSTARGLARSQTSQSQPDRHAAQNAEAKAILQAIEKEAGITQPLPVAQHAFAREPHWVQIPALLSRNVSWRTMLAIIVKIVYLFGSYSITG
jgi:MFS transporter, putative metabolite:H+ symporter